MSEALMERLLRAVVCASVIAAGTLLAAGTASAADPIGVWLVADGSAQIQIENCGGSLWGVVVWEKTPGYDENNPNPSLRGRPVLGIPILLGLRPGVKQTWEGPRQAWLGHVYNAKNGETYDVDVRLTSPDVLHLEGCVLGGIFCGGQDWTRVSAPAQARASARRNSSKPSASVCSRVPSLAGGTH